MKPSIGIVLIAVVVLLIIMSLSLFIVDQRQNAIVFRFGEIVSVKKEPGLAVKMPLIDNVRFFAGGALSWHGSLVRRRLGFVG